ncbi:MAG: LTA synthase family protein [Chitinophagaceae bacterium]|nr:LTA synthase family protein [Chitinophagaceae bacterium]
MAGVVLFFVVHGMAENKGLIPISEIGFFLLKSFGFLLLFFMLLKWRKWPLYPATIVLSFGLFFYLFFGAIQDALKSTFLASLSKYSVLLPLFVVLIFVGFRTLKNHSKAATRLNRFLNTLLTVFILVDLVSLAVVNNNAALPLVTPHAKLKSQSSVKPNIYLLVMDEYAGEKSLQQNLHFNNQAFLSKLTEKGFYIASNASSNYASTPISMASFFEMSYNNWLDLKRPIKAEDYSICAKKMSESSSMKWLSDLGYETINLSIFDFTGKPSLNQSSFLKQGIQLITNKTLASRMERDLIWMVYQYIAPKWDGLATYLANKGDEGNRKLYQLTLEEINKDKQQPKFVYTHLMMPHYPYVRDSSGALRKGNLFQSLTTDQQKGAYLQYLNYANTRILELLKAIEFKEKGKAIVMVIGDHGYRADPKQQSCFDTHNNLVAVYLPQRNYQYLYPSISNVNVFKAVFKSTFDSTLVFEKDRCIE